MTFPVHSSALISCRRGNLLSSHPPFDLVQGPRRSHHVENAAEGSEGDGSAHQPHLPLPPEPLQSSGLVVREHEAPNGRDYHWVRRVHEFSPG